jgi:alginate O-acetyltransferase complex protein AlgI
MLQNALYFFLFISIMLFLFYKTKQHILVLFFAGLLFMAFMQWRAIPLLLLNSLFTFYLAQKIAAAKTQKNTFFIFGIAALLAQLLLFKLFVFSEQRLSGFSLESIAFTLGFSFYTLQNIAYLFDVKIGRILPEENALLYVVSTAYFPKILCGPVVTFQRMKKHLMVIPVFKEENLVAGINRFALGAFKKLVIADRLAPMTTAVFDSSDTFSGFTSLFAGLVFTLQVYFDFSGYVDMALGISRMFGITLPENFSTPLRSISITQFWRRWHITLMQWLTQYVYYPVSYWFRKNAFLSAFFGIVITLLFSAFWHGLGLTFLLWAFCHITYLTIELLAQKAKFKLPKAITYLLTILAVSFANLFFRSGDFSTVKKLMGEVFSLKTFWPSDWLSQFIAVFGRGAELNDLFNFSLSWTFVLLFLLFENKINQKSNSEKFNVFWLATIILLILVFGIFSSGEQFIYSKF